MELGDARVSMNANEDIAPSSGEKPGDGPVSSDSGENAVMPDIYAAEPAPKAIDIELVSPPPKDDDELDDDESFGFDPYDTAKLHNKK